MEEGDIHDEPDRVTFTKIDGFKRKSTFCGVDLPRMEITYLIQIIVLYAIIITSLTNLCLKNGPLNLWISLLSSSIGYLLPQPTLSPKRRHPAKE